MRPLRSLCMLSALLSAVAALLSVAAEPLANEHFERTWARTDQPVAAGMTARTWMWGPEPITGQKPEYWYYPATLPPSLTEKDYPDVRFVQYFDKSRMEITDADGDPSSPWYVTNGLLVVELMSGRKQVGVDDFFPLRPAYQQVAGDQGGVSPGYDDLAQFMSEPPFAMGEVIDDGLDWYAEMPGYLGLITWYVVPNQERFAVYGVRSAHYVVETNHSIAEPFWEFMNSRGLVYSDGQYVEEQLFLNPYYATGFPITEAYWANLPVGGLDKHVLIQCFERRCLTYTPDNAPEWRVESGNVGQHYFAWRSTLQALDHEEAGELIVALDGSLYLIGPDYVESLPAPVESDGIRLSMPAWSPDGAWIALVGTRKSDFSNALYLMRPDGSDFHEIAAGSLGGRPAWSPDGKRIAFNRSIVGELPSVWIIDLETSEETRVATGEDPAWSPDGNALVYDRLTSLHVHNLVSGTSEEIFAVPSVESITTAAWSPDGASLAVSVSGNWTEGISPRVVVMASNGGAPSQLSVAPIPSVRLVAWLDDGRIAFSTWEEIYTMNADGTGLQGATWGLSQDIPISFDWQQP